MNYKVLIGVGVVIAAVFWLTSGTSEEAVTESVFDAYEVVSTYATDVQLTEPMTIDAGMVSFLKSGVTLTTAADLTINGAIGCDGGDLELVVEGQLTINGLVACEADTGHISIVATGGLLMSAEAEIIAGGDVQIVDAAAQLRNREALAALYDATETVADTGFSVGPIVDDETELEDQSEAAPAAVTAASRPSFWQRFARVAHAQVDNGTTTVNLTGEPIRVSGKITVGTPRPGARRIVVFDFPNTPEVTIQDFELEGPTGRAGEADNGSCDVTGEPGEDAFRFNANAPNLIVNNFTLILGDGGVGGDATTGNGCEDARAKGGKGGKPGNFRMIGSEKFEITGAFMVHPGTGGAGGNATAKGKLGDPDQKGGDARAEGGDGADNKKKLSVNGTVAGTSNVQFGDAVGGAGGAATAEGGQGGDASECGLVGGAGGNAVAIGGDGGDAKLTVAGGAVRMPGANDIGGQGGFVTADGGVGGAGGSCDETKKGGNGGVGGNANTTEGDGGLGKNGRADDGGVWSDHGGNGGAGGDGCTEGMGGAGGTGGDEDGEKGADGKNICLSITKEEDYISLLPGEIEVIQYMDYYIPVANVRRVTGEECGGDEHWHPAAGGAINTMGYNTPDPDPSGCGFGRTAEVPVQIIQDPNYQAEAGTEDGEMVPVELPAFGAPMTQPPIGGHSGPAETEGGGEMIQIDPPTLVIPANFSR